MTISDTLGHPQAETGAAGTTPPRGDLRQLFPGLISWKMRQANININISAGGQHQSAVSV